MSRYQNLIGETDYIAACQKVQKDGYATDPSYSKLLIQLIEQYGMNQYDIVEEVEEVETCSVVVNGQALEGFIKDGRSYAPVGQFGNVIKADVYWDEDSKTVTVEAKIVEPVTVLVNGQPAGLDGLLTDGHSYAPVRAVAESLGARVEWDGETRTANIIPK